MAFVSVPLGVGRPRASTRPSATCVRMALGTHVGEDTKADDFLTIGVAKVFRRKESKIEELLIIEPLPASALDCVARLQVPTSYMRIWATTLGELPDRIDEFPESVRSNEKLAFGEDFTERCQASARTYRRSPEIVDLLPIGSIFSDVNHSVERKRIIDDDWEPDFSDNVKQDISIDV